MHAISAKTLGVGTLYARSLPPQPMVRFRSGRHRSRAPVVPQLGHSCLPNAAFCSCLLPGGDAEDFMCTTCAPSLGPWNAFGGLMAQGCRTVLRTATQRLPWRWACWPLILLPHAHELVPSGRISRRPHRGLHLPGPPDPSGSQDDGASAHVAVDFIDRRHQRRRLCSPGWVDQK